MAKSARAQVQQKRIRRKAVAVAGLPRYLAKPEVNKKSAFYNGRYAQGHPNGIDPATEQWVSTVRAMLQLALERLAKWDGQVLPLDAAEDLRVAYNALDDVARHLPDLEAWCVVVSYTDNWSTPWVVSGHLSQVEAEQWLPLWKKKFADRTDYQIDVKLTACDIGRVVEPGLDPTRFVR